MRVVSLFSFLLVFLLNALSNAKEQSGDAPNVRISPKYYRGEYLIFDCQDLHFACVNLEGFQLCQEWRREDLQKKRLQLKCAPLKKFPSQKACFKEQEKQIARPKTKKVFCSHRPG